MAEPIPPEGVPEGVTDEGAWEEAGEESTEFREATETLEKAQQELAADPTNEQLQEAEERASEEAIEAQNTTIDKVGESMGLDNLASDMREGKTPAVVDELPEKAMEGLQKELEETQKKNGEEGKSAKDSPKSMRELLFKYGFAAVAMLLALGAAIGTLAALAKEMSGCFMVNQASGQVQKLACQKSFDCSSECNCASIASIQQLCGSQNPGCGSGGVTYICKKYNIFSVLAELPRMIIKTAQAASGAAQGFLNALRKFWWIILLVIVAAILVPIIIRAVRSRQQSNPRS